MTSTLASSYTATSSAFVGGSFGGEGGSTNTHSSSHKSSVRSPSTSLKASSGGGHLVAACVRHSTTGGEAVKSQQQCYLRQYTFDVFPHPQNQGSSNSSGDHPSAWSRSLYSETTRPFSSAGAHSSTSATSDDEEEEVIHSTPRRPTYRLGRKLNLTFLPGDRPSPPNTIHHHHHLLPYSPSSAVSSQQHSSRPVHFGASDLAAVTPRSPQTSVTEQLSPHCALGTEEEEEEKEGYPYLSYSSHHQPVISSEPNLRLHRSPVLPHQQSPIPNCTSPETPPVFLPPQQEMPLDVQSTVPPTVCSKSVVDSSPSTSSRPDPQAPSSLQSVSSNSVPALRKAASSNVSQEAAATMIARAWRTWKAEQQLHLTTLVEAIQKARHSAAITIQRVWKGHQLRRFVHDEVCKLRVLYWEPSMNDLSHRELEENWNVKIFGSFTVPAWKSEVVMKYCRVRRMFVLYTSVPPGRYECKFIVNGKHSNCPWLHETTLTSDGIANSLINITAHPVKDWWGKRLAYLGHVRKSRSSRSKGPISSCPREHSDSRSIRNGSLKD